MLCRMIMQKLIGVFMLACALVLPSARAAITLLDTFPLQTNATAGNTITSATQTLSCSPGATVLIISFSGRYNNNPAGLSPVATFKNSSGTTTTLTVAVDCPAGTGVFTESCILYLFNPSTVAGQTLSIAVSGTAAATDYAFEAFTLAGVDTNFRPELNTGFVGRGDQENTNAVTSTGLSTGGVGTPTPAIPVNVNIPNCWAITNFTYRLGAPGTVNSTITTGSGTPIAAPGLINGSTVASANFWHVNSSNNCLDGGSLVQNINTGGTTFTATAPGASGNHFTIAAAVFTPFAPPTLSTFAPATGGSNGGTVYTITGTNLSANQSVTIGGIAAPVTGVDGTFTTMTGITGPTPAGYAGFGTAQDVVLTYGPGQTQTLSAQFTYTQAPAPVFGSIAPGSGSTSAPTNAVVTGSNFVTAANSPPGTKVSLKNGATVIPIAATVNSNTTINVTLPVLTVGTYDVIVTNPDGQTQTAAGKVTVVFSGTPPESVFNIKFRGAVAGTANPMQPAETAGLIPRANWNDIQTTAASGASGTLVDQNGVTSAAGTNVTWANSAASGTAGNNDTPGQQRLMRSFMGCAANSTLAIKVNSLPSSFSTGIYDVYVYLGSANNNAYALFSLTAPIPPGAPVTSAYTVGGKFVNNPGFKQGIFQKANGSRGLGNYIVFSNCTGTSFEVDVQAASQSIGIAGIQVVQLNHIHRPVPGITGWNQDAVMEDTAANASTATLGFADGSANTQPLFEARQGTRAIAGTITTIVSTTAGASGTAIAANDIVVAPWTAAPAATTQYRVVTAFGGNNGNNSALATTNFFCPSLTAVSYGVVTGVTAGPAGSTITSVGTAVTGDATATFTTTFTAGQVIIAGGQAQAIASITDNTHLTLVAPFQPLGDITTATAYSKGVYPTFAIAQGANGTGTASTLTAVTPTVTMSASTTPVVTGDWICAPYNAAGTGSQYRRASQIVDSTHFITSAYFNTNLGAATFAKLTVIAAPPGTITTSGTLVTGVGTTFTTTFAAGTQVLIVGEQGQTIASVTDNTHMILAAALPLGDINVATAYSAGQIPGAAVAAETLTTAGNASNVALGIGTAFSTDDLCLNDFITVGGPLRAVSGMIQGTGTTQYITLDAFLNPWVNGVACTRIHGISDGMPRAGNNGLNLITSENDESTQYQFQSYTGNNVLNLKTPSSGTSTTGTLTISPAVYMSNLRILAATSEQLNGNVSNDELGTVTINYADGTSSAAQNLFVPCANFVQGNGGFTNSLLTSAGLTYLSKSASGNLTTFKYAQYSLNLFETQLVNPNPGKQISSLTFASPTTAFQYGTGGGNGINNVNTSGNLATGTNTAIFAVSGNYALGMSIASVTPSFGPAGGGTPVTIKGTGFSAGATVTIGAASATSVSVVNATTITCITPPGTAGKLVAVQVSVATPSPDSTIKADGFYYSTGANPPGDTISVRYRGTGGALMAVTEVAGVIPRAYWNDGLDQANNGASPLYMMDNMGFTTGAFNSWSGAGGSGNVNPNTLPTAGDGKMMNAFFTNQRDILSFRMYSLPPTWNTCDVYVYMTSRRDGNKNHPEIASTNGGNLVFQNRGIGVIALADVQFPRQEAANAAGEPTINGFMRVPDNNSVGGAATAKSRQGNYVYLPNVQVVGGRLNYALCAGNGFPDPDLAISGIQLVAYNPTLLSANPAGCSVAGAVTITLTGTNFRPGVRSLTFGGTEATNVTVVNSTTITCTAPAHAAGVVDINLVDVNYRTAALTAGFTYTSATLPTITSVAPPTGPDNTSITITGTGFKANSTVTVGGTNGFAAQPATSVVVTVPNSITCTVPSAIAASNTILNTVTPFNPPLSNVAYSKASIGVARTGTISSIGTAVTGNATTFTTAPAFTAGSVLYANGQFRTVTGTPTATSMTINAPFSPDLIYGQNYYLVTLGAAGTSNISSNGTTVTAAADQQFAATFVPGDVISANGQFAVVASVSASLGATRVTVANPTDQTQAVRENGFTYTNSLPAIASVSPNTGLFYVPTAVTVTFTSALPGNFLSAGGSIAFGGINATDVVVTSATTMTCTILPLNATAAINAGASTATNIVVDGIVTFPGGQLTTPIAADQFTYTSPSGTPRVPENPSDVMDGTFYRYYTDAAASGGAGLDGTIPAAFPATPLRAGSRPGQTYNNGFQPQLISSANLSFPQSNTGGVCTDNQLWQITGYLVVPYSGSYTFYTCSDDRSKLYIGTTLVVDNNAAGAGGTTPPTAVHTVASNAIALLQGLHAFTFQFANNGGVANGGSTTFSAYLGWGCNDTPGGGAANSELATVVVPADGTAITGDTLIPQNLMLYRPPTWIGGTGNFTTAAGWDNGPGFNGGPSGFGPFSPVRSSNLGADVAQNFAVESLALRFKNSGNAPFVVTNDAAVSPFPIFVMDFNSSVTGNSVAGTNPFGFQCIGPINQYKQNGVPLQPIANNPAIRQAGSGDVTISAPVAVVQDRNDAYTLQFAGDGSGVVRITGPLQGTSANQTLTKSGLSTFSIDSATGNTYRGNITVNAGTLGINGTVTQAAITVTVASGAALRGTGTVTGNVAFTSSVPGQLGAGTVIAPGQGTLFPGDVASFSTADALGVLTVASANLTGGNGGRLRVRIKNGAQGTIASDKLVTTAAAAVTLGGASSLDLRVQTSSAGYNKQDVQIVGMTGFASTTTFGSITITAGTTGATVLYTKAGFVPGVTDSTDIANIAFTQNTLTGAVTSVGGGSYSNIFVRFDGSVTPVKLDAFTAKPEGAGAMLEWTAVSEFRNAGFNIYRRALDGGSWTRANTALIAGRITSADEKAYALYDWAPAGTFEYKLECVDIQGALETYYPAGSPLTIDWNSALQPVSAQSLDAASGSLALTESSQKAEQVASRFAALDAALSASPVNSRLAPPDQFSRAPRALALPAASVRELVSEASLSAHNFGSSLPTSVSAISSGSASRAGVRWFSSGSGASTFTAAKVTYRDSGVLLIPQAALPAGFDINHVAIQRESRALNALAVTPAGLLVYAPGYNDQYTDVDALFLRRTSNVTSAGHESTASGLFNSTLPVNVSTPATATKDFHDVYFDFNVRPFTFEPWFSAQYLSQGTAQEFALDTPQASNGAAALTVNLWSVSDSPLPGPDHALQVAVNGTLVGQTQWEGGNKMLQFTFDVPQGVLRSGQNTVTLVTPALPNQEQLCFLHSISAAYRACSMPPRRLKSPITRLVQRSTNSTAFRRAVRGSSMRALKTARCSCRPKQCCRPTVHTACAS